MNRGTGLVFKLVIVVLSVLSLTVCVPVWAITVNKPLFNNTDRDDMVVYVFWKDIEPDVVLISPSKKRISRNNIQGTGTYESKKGFTKVVIGSPETGQWDIELSREKSAGQVEIRVEKIVDTMRVERVEANINNSVLNVSWKIVNSQNKNKLNIQAYIVTNDKARDGRAIFSKQDQPETGSFSYNMPADISSGNYYIYLVTKEKIKAGTGGGIDDLAYGYSNKIVYVNPASPGKINNIRVSNSVETILLKWDRPEIPGLAGYRVFLFEKGKEEPIQWRDLPLDMLEYEFWVEEGKEYEAAVAALSKDKVEGIYDRTPVNISQMKDGPIKVHFPVESTMNVRKLRIGTEFPQGYTMSVFNNNKMLSNHIKSSCTVVVDTEEGDNKLEFKFVGADGVERIFSKELFIDLTAPQLELFKDYDRLFWADKSIEIMGNVEPSAELSINGQKVTPDVRGFFSFPLNLHIGPNKVKMEGKDAAGNLALYQARIYYFNGPLLLVLALVVSLGISIPLLIRYMNRRRKAE